MKLNKEILYLAIPNILSNVSVPLLSSVDTGLMGRMSTAHVAAIGISSMLFNLLYWNFGFLRMGTTGMVAQAYGADDKERVSAVSSKAVLLAIFIAMMILLLQNVYYGFGANFLKVQDGHSDIVYKYFSVRIWDAPATLLLYCQMGIFFGLQNAIIPMVVTIVINIINIVVSYYLVVYAGWDAEGVAWGTVAAQYTGCVISFVILKMKFNQSFRIIDLIRDFKWKDYAAFLKVNGNIFIRTVSMTFVFALLYRFGSDRGELILASNVIILQMINWMSYGIDGFAYAAESLVGKYHGANNNEQLSKVIKLSFVWGGVVSLLFAVVYWCFGDVIIELYTTEIELIKYSWNLKIILVLVPILGCAAYVWDGIFIGLVASKGLRDSMLWAVAVFLIIYFALPKMDYGFDIWYAFMGFLVARGIVQTVIYERQLKGSF